jgi:hypothetical protein
MIKLSTSGENNVSTVSTVVSTTPSRLDQLEARKRALSRKDSRAPRSSGGSFAVRQLYTDDEEVSV